MSTTNEEDTNDQDNRPADTDKTSSSEDIHRSSPCDTSSSTVLNEKGSQTERKMRVRGSALSHILKDTVRSRERMDDAERQLAQKKLKELDEKLSDSLKKRRIS